MMLVPNNNSPEYKGSFIYFITYYFEEYAIIIYWIASMNLYLFDIVESYKYTIIRNLGN